jgi:hypothetical protein
MILDLLTVSVDVIVLLYLLAQGFKNAAQVREWSRASTLFARLHPLASAAIVLFGLAMTLMPWGAITWIASAVAAVVGLGVFEAARARQQPKTYKA